VLGLQLQADDGSETDCSITSIAEVSLPSGDEGDELGAGDPTYTLGMAFGIMLEEDTAVVLDGRYTIFPDVDDVFTFGIGVIYEVHPRLWITLEAVGTDEDVTGSDDNPLFVTGGMAYRGLADLDNLVVSWAAGAGMTDASPDSVGSLRIAYEF